MAKAKTKVGALQASVPFIRNPEDLVGHVITGVLPDYNGLILVLDAQKYFCVQVEDYQDSCSMTYQGIVIADQLVKLGLIDKEVYEKAKRADNAARNKETKKLEDDNLRAFVKTRKNKIAKILSELEEQA